MSQHSLERTILVGLEQPNIARWELLETLEELRQLAITAGAEVIEIITQKLEHPTAPYYIGKGKAEERAARRSISSLAIGVEAGTSGLHRLATRP